MKSKKKLSDYIPMAQPALPKNPIYPKTVHNGNSSVVAKPIDRKKKNFPKYNSYVSPKKKGGRSKY